MVFLKFEIVYFYNVYGPNQISRDIWRQLLVYLKNNLRNWAINYSQAQTKLEDLLIFQIQLLFVLKPGEKIIVNTMQFHQFKITQFYKLQTFWRSNYLPERPGERYSSALTKMNLSNKIINKIGKKILKYISDFKKIINGQKILIA